MSTGIEFHFKRAERYYKDGKYKEAIDEYTRIINAAEASGTEKANAYTNRGSTKGALGKYDEAIKDFTEAIQKGDTEVQAMAHLNRGTTKVSLGKHEEAIADYDKAIEYKPDHTPAYINRGNAQYALKHHEEAIADYDKAIALNPDHAMAYNNRGTTKGALGKYEEEIVDYDKAIKINPDYADAYFNRGATKEKLGKHEEAIVDFDKAIALNPDHAMAYLGRGAAKVKLGKYEEAIKDFDKAITLNPDLAAAYLGRGLAKDELRQYKEAIVDYTEAIQKGDTEIQANAYLSRGLAKGKLGRHKEANEDFDTAIQKGDTEIQAKAYFNRGNAKERLGKHDEAIKDYDKAIEINPDYAEAYHNRGIAKSALGRHKEANKDYRKAIDMQCKHAGEDYTSITCYKFIPINKNTIDMLVKNTVYFSDVPSLNDPLECPLLEDKVFKKAFQGKYQPRILSLVVPFKGNKQDKKKRIHPIVKNTLLFSHYADAHKGICIEYRIDKEFLEQGTMFYTDVQYIKDKDTRAKSIQHLFAIKDERWEYEHEGRFVAFGKQKLYPLKGACITKIIFGLKTTDEDKALLVELLRGKKPDKEPQVQFFNTSNVKEKYFNFVFKEYKPKGTEGTQTE